MRIVVLTGAGISAESGVATFRDADGLWEGHHVEEVATPEGYDADPALVHAFYDARRAALADVAPNPAHLALGRLEAVLGDDLTIVTQNVDDLHERGGAHQVLHMHGELLSAWCRACGRRFRWEGTLGDRPACPGCGISELRPDIVWFGEMPYGMDRISAAIAEADLFVSIGTSGAVYPAAGFVIEARARGIRSLEINLEPSEGTHWFDEARHGKAGDLVPRWVDEVLGQL